jgi:hypothetical protein
MYVYSKSITIQMLTVNSCTQPSLRTRLLVCDLFTPVTLFYIHFSQTRGVFTAFAMVTASISAHSSTRTHHRQLL